MNTKPLKGIAIGPGLFLVEFGEIASRFPSEWSYESILQLLNSLGLRPILGPSSSLWYLKEALDAALVAATHPLHPHPGAFNPATHKVNRRFVQDFHDNLLACILAYRSANLVPNRKVDIKALEQALAQLGESISRSHAPKEAGKPLTEESLKCLRLRRNRSVPPPE